MRCHDHTDCPFDALILYVCQYILDEWMPVSHAYEGLEMITICVQRGFEGICLCLCSFKNGRTPANFAIPFANFMNDLWRCWAIAAHIQQIWLYLIKGIGPTICHYKDTDSHAPTLTL